MHQNNVLKNEAHHLRSSINFLDGKDFFLMFFMVHLFSKMLLIFGEKEAHFPQMHFLFLESVLWKLFERAALVHKLPLCLCWRASTVAKLEEETILFNTARTDSDRKCQIEGDPVLRALWTSPGWYPVLFLPPETNILFIGHIHFFYMTKLIGNQD